MAFTKITVTGLVALTALAGCVEDTGSTSGRIPTPEEQACLRAVGIETGNPDYALLGSSFSEAGTEVIVGVGEQRARWQCIAYSDGTTSRPMSLTDEGI
ncbi:hypothetical protein QO034_14385 [Sedimentitalea sp. JM2-8]|uniref:Lipoprotein n=1 Tax=Sedimentitalea xiamensis TaxID=3050037 RepID=A0ABT7FGM0_9RHOB|nr:hypothetical protein [Sedimentitalea xiamensis]MDK3074296.1 hypothetical protein [Sedimentitalea xiamensis]